MTKPQALNAQRNRSGHHQFFLQNDLKPGNHQRSNFAHFKTNFKIRYAWASNLVLELLHKIKNNFEDRPCYQLLMNFQSGTRFLGHPAANYPISMILNSSIASYEFCLENFSKQSLKIWLFVNHLIDLQVFIALSSLNTNGNVLSKNMSSCRISWEPLSGQIFWVAIVPCLKLQTVC